MDLNNCLLGEFQIKLQIDSSNYYQDFIVKILIIWEFIMNSCNIPSLLNIWNLSITTLNKRLYFVCHENAVTSRIKQVSRSWDLSEYNMFWSVYNHLISANDVYKQYKSLTLIKPTTSENQNLS